MKKTLLIGLAAVALGSMTACSNILEEEGTISASAKTGKLVIGLETDGAVNIVTKSTENVTFTDAQKSEIIITGTATGTNIPENYQVPTTEGTHIVYVGTYNYTATNETMENDFEWNKPYFWGTKQVVVSANGVAADGNIICDLMNSIIDISDESFNDLGTNGVIVTYLYVVNYDGTIEKNTDLTSKNKIYFYNKEDQTSLKTDFLYAKSDLTNVKIVVEGYLTADDTKTFRGVADIKSGSSIGADNKYNVTFDLNKTQGSLALDIEVNGTVTSVPIEVDVNPYE